MKIGDIVRDRESGIYGTVEFSSFGVSIHFINGESGALGKTLGDSVQNVSRYWEVVDMPEGYEIGKWGGLKKL